MNSPGQPAKQLDQYLNAFRQRLQTLSLLRGAAVASLVLLLVSAAGAWFALERGYADSVVISARLLLLLSLAAVTVFCIILPRKRLNDHSTTHFAKQVEGRSPGFKGRIETYLDLKAAQNPMAELLAEDALKVSQQHPVASQVTPKEFRLAGAAIAATLTLLLYLLIAGPGMLNFSLRNLLGGWAFGDVLPPRMIVVAPGDQSVRRGANLRISSTVEGLDPNEVTIHVRRGSDDWQSVPMVRGPDGFEFTFFSMQEAMQYYVTTTGLRSPNYDIDVVDLPDLTNLSLTYHYPDWSQRESDTFNPGGDIRTLEETRVELNMTTSSPLSQGVLVLNGEEQRLAISGTEASTDFTVTEEGEYYLAAVVGDETVRLSDDYFIRITEDGRPEIEFIQPGRDWNASNIEEVLTRIEASDDYGLNRVTLKYSVNGGEWQSVDLNQEHQREVSTEYLFMLEDMRARETRAPQGAQVGAFTIVREGNDEAGNGTDQPQQQAGSAPQPDAETDQGEAAEVEMVPLQPGDLISYYAEAEDRSNIERTDMYFIQVQPYNRRFSQSQLSGGGGGQQGGGPGDEISQRQRQIIVSTWNLIREEEEGEDPTSIDMNSSLLADLQTTLAEQAQTLTDRAKARRLTNDPQIESFISSMEQAVQAMHPAAQQLAEVALDDAIQPAQEALQHLLRAESVFTDMTISQQQGGGGQGQAQRDIAEMFELELDMKKNQYETGNRASNQSQQEQAEDLMQQLDELAKRQEQLANNLRNQNQLTDAQRWQQEMLRREAEQLRQQLEQLQRNQSQSGGQGQQQANNQQGEASQQAEAQGQGNSEQSPTDPQQQIAQNQAEQNEPMQSELQRRLDSAIRAMNETSEAMRNAANNPPSAEQLQRSAEEASRQLQGARDQVAQEQLASLQESFSGMADQANDMLRDQQGMQRQLQQAMSRAVEERESGENPNSRGMSLSEEWQLARAKQTLAEQIQQLQQKMLNTLQEYGGQAPEAGQELQRANDELVESQLEQAVSDAALYIDSGYGLYIAGNENNVTRAMERLAVSLERARQLAQTGSNQADSELARAQAQARELRSQMQEHRQQAAAGREANGSGREETTDNEQAQQTAQQQGSQQGQQTAANEAGDNAQNNGAAGNQTAQNSTSNNNSGSSGSGNWWNNGPDNLNGPINLPEDFYGNLDNLTQAARDAVPEMNLGGEELSAMYDLIRELEYSRANRSGDLLAQEYNDMLALVEQLEVSLQQDDDNNRRHNVRTAIQETIPEEYRDSVAEYYRRLSQDN